MSRPRNPNLGFVRGVPVSQLTSEQKEKKQEYDRKYYRENRERLSQIHANYRATEKYKNRKKEQYSEIKKQVYDFYGQKCSCCGETNSKFLGIDHILNNGAEEKKQYGRSTGKLYTVIIAKGFPPEYRILCHNCNLGRFLNGGVCPHQESGLETFGCGC